jgi:hypothetical protein
VVVGQRSLVVVNSVAVFAFAAATVYIVCTKDGIVIEAMMQAMTTSTTSTCQAICTSDVIGISC